MRYPYFIAGVIFAGHVLLFATAQVLAQSSSTNYQVEESMFGTGGELDASSTIYKAQQSAGANAAGFASSANYDAQGGFLTQNEEFLAMTVTGATVSFGTLDPNAFSSGAAQAGTCNCSFTVRTYVTSAYSVITMSQPPISEGGAILDAKSTLGVPSSDPNIEEFGINLRDNTSPNIGANPSNQPDNTFADGQAATGYSTIDQFKYGVGDTIANSAATGTNPAIGETWYTISYVAKPKNQTEAGFYTMNHDLVVVATF
jgi:hypothetical protein